MFDWLLTNYHDLVNMLSGSSDGISKGLIGVWVLTTATFLLRRIPFRIYQAIKSRLIVSITLLRGDNNASATWNELGRFERWFSKLPSSRFDRNRQLRPYSKGPLENRFGPGVGWHWFIYNNRFYWFVKRRLESSGIEFEKEEIKIFTYGINIKPLLDVYEQFAYSKPKNVIECHQTADNQRPGWIHVDSIDKDKVLSPILPPTIMEDLEARVEWFLNNEQWYNERGLAYKLTILLYGVPGTGKTSIIRYLCKRFNRDLFMMNLKADARAFSHLLKKASDKSIIAIEDFDDSGVVKKRDYVKTVDDSEAVGLSTLLNGLDGVSPIDKRIIIMTTNHPEHIDPALLRPGRCDLRVEIGYLGSPEIHRYIQRMYPGVVYDTTTQFPNRKGSELHDCFLRSPHDLETFIDEVKLYKPTVFNTATESA